MKNLIYLIVLLASFSAKAGSFEDWFQAIKQDDPRTVSSLLARGFDPNTIGPSGVHGLFQALQEGSVKVADVLVTWPKTNVEWRSDKDESPLMIAAIRGHAELVRKLVARGADVNKTGWTPLHYAATSGHVAIIEFLLEQHAYIDAESPNKTTPLMMAAHYGTSQAVKLLLESGADPGLRNDLGLTALDFATRGQRPDAVAILTVAVKSSAPKGKW
jgi:ankyrin repeat protein